MYIYAPENYIFQVLVYTLVVALNSNQLLKNTP